MRHIGSQFNKLQVEEEEHSQSSKTAETRGDLDHQDHQPYYDNARNGNTFADLVVGNRLMLFLIAVGVVLTMLIWKYETFRSKGQPAMDNINQSKGQVVLTNEPIPMAKEKPVQLILNKSVSELEEIVRKMQHPANRPATIRNVKKSTAKQDEVYFAYSLSQKPLNQDFLQAEYFYYDRKYNLSSMGDELPICVTIVGRNLGQSFNRMIDSVLRQNYSNYRIAFVDDQSGDETKSNLERYSSSNQLLKDKASFIWQKERMFALHNRHLAISQHCQADDIIVDVDADDWLIGNQVFKVVNALYQDPQLWACYFNNIIYSEACNCPLMNADAIVTEEMLRANTYRVGEVWRTTELRTFRKAIYDKIDPQDFKDEKGNFYKWKSDAFINIPIVQLAGPSHVKFLDQFLYFYDTSFSKPSDQKAYSRLAAKTQTPYNPLGSLSDQARKQTNYSPPQKLLNRFNQLKSKLSV